MATECVQPTVFCDDKASPIEQYNHNDIWFLYIITGIIYILLLASVIAGINSAWYKNLKKSTLSPYVLGILWVVAGIVSYIGIFILWHNSGPEDAASNLQISIYFMIANLLGLLWSAVYFQGNNIVIAAWLAAGLLLYEFWLLIHIWYIKPIAAAFLVPLVILYGYLFYSMLHVASLNGVEI